MMKKYLLLLLLSAACLSAAEKKIMTIGNSFASSLRRDLPEIVAAQGDKLVIGYANHGGCSIQQHWKYVCEEEADPAVKHYRYQNRKMKLREMLAAEKWDIVTVQQVSSLSWVEGSFYPELDNLIAYIRKYAPGAEIVLQQTWAYRIDSPRLKKWRISQSQMYEKICRNYREASEKYGFRVIPSGLAVELARAKQPVKFVPVDSKVVKKAAPGSVIDQPGSLINGWVWRKIRKTGEEKFISDTIHLNNRGEYLQCCVWYGLIYGESPRDIKYQGRDLTPADAAMLRECAAEALEKDSKEFGKTSRTSLHGILKVIVKSPLI